MPSSQLLLLARARRRSRLGPARTSEGPAQDPSVFLFVILTAQLMVVLDTTIVNVALPAHSRGPRPLRRRALLGPQRLPAHLRRPPAPGGPVRRPARPAPHLPGRDRPLHGELALRWVRRLGLDAPVRPGPPGGRRRPGRAVLAGPPDHHLLRRAPAGPGHRPLHHRVGGRGRDRPRCRRRATQLVSWRWVMFVNVPIGIAVLLVGRVALQETERRTDTSTSPAPSPRPWAWWASCSGSSRPAPAGGRAS